MLRWAEYGQATLCGCLYHFFIVVFFNCTGSNNVLDSMRREYTVEEFEKVANFLRTNVSSV